MPDESARVEFFDRSNSVQVASYLSDLFNKTPLDFTAETLWKFIDQPDAIEQLFAAYNSFLCILSDDSKRRHLESLKPEQLEDDQLYADARMVSHSFADAVTSIFLTQNNPIGELTIRYGVF
jgi:hypothetical protein